MENTLFEQDIVKSDRIIYTPSEFARKTLTYLQEVGQLEALKPHLSKRENLSSFLFFIVLKGSGTLFYNGIEYEIKSGDCIFLNCKYPYHHLSSNDLWTLKWIHFYGYNIDSIYDKYIEREGKTIFTSQNLNNYIDILDDIYQIAKSNIYIRDMKIYEKLTSLLTMLMEENFNPLSNYSISTKKRNLLAIKDFLENNYQNKITLDILEKNFYINKFYLNRQFKEQFGTTITNYLIQIRITHSKHLLRFSNMSIEKIAQESGMNDANYFSRIFKKVEGISPGEYRKKWL